ncbi:MAG: DUF445 domain-containing protein, partial [Selenomonadales bacterium]|nr:DUF445 domain-containing protein [Selenomonadales bacterium]
IGGLADWFAVSAIFTKPLGVSFKTDLIVNNRHRLEQGVGRMVSEELLTAESVDSFLEKYDLGAMAVTLYDKMNGEKYLREQLAGALRKVFTMIDEEAVLALVRLAVQGGAGSVDWRAVLAGASAELAKDGHLDEAGRVLLAEARRIAESQELYDILRTVASDALHAYESGGTGRQFLHSMMDLSPERCADLVRAKLVERIAEEEAMGRGAKHFAYILSWGIGSLPADKLPDMMADAAADKVRAWLDETRRALDESPESVTWLAKLAERIGKEVDSLLLDDERNAWFNQKMRELVCQGLAEHKDKLATLAENGVKNMPDEMLTGMLKEKVGHDLQMIRVNGSLVGALAGAMLYLLRYAWKAVAL